VIFSIIGATTFIILSGGYWYFSRRTPLGSLSLPCIALLVAAIYFFLMPFMAIKFGNPVFFGSVLDDMRWMHFAVLLYAAGVMMAAKITERYLRINPADLVESERGYNQYTFIILLCMSFAGAIAMAALGQINISASSDFLFSGTSTTYKFLNYSFTMMIGLTIIYLIKDDFNFKSLILLIIVTLILVQTGFRYRIMLLMFGVCVSFLLIKRIKIRAIWAVFGTFVAVFIGNLIGIGRVYGNGIQASRWNELTFSDIMSSFGGEVGPVYVFKDFTANHLPYLIYFEPWTVGISRLIPSFLWEDKPDADYIRLIPYWFSDPAAIDAGVAAPQHVEILLQFGWIGLPFLACFYFCIAGLLYHWLQGLSRAARIAGSALIPAFFGYYMQTRGYFFQVFTDALFLFGPLFLCHFPAPNTSFPIKGRKA
jgi:hypothetical protein